MTRYDQLITLINLFQPQTIVETGVWNGNNAARMIEAAGKHHALVEYVGYDLFEDATAETDAAEFNVKPHNNATAVKGGILSQLTCKASVHLIKGDTNKTLNDTAPDFAFIDGGHSIATIDHDYNKLAYSKVIVLDDYYTPDETGACPDVSKFGCNELVGSLDNKKVFILPHKDRVKGGGFCQFVLVV